LPHPFCEYPAAVNVLGCPQVYSAGAIHATLAEGETDELVAPDEAMRRLARRHRVIHSDLKPSNILLTEAGVPKLLDFGVARLLDLDSAGRTGDATATAHRVMTPEYASPEQLRGLPPTQTDDVYSLGVLLYILLTGGHPYRFSSRAPEEVLRSILAGRVRRPSEAVHDSPPSAGGDSGP
jgi:serine/threonine protein kinase